MSSIGPAGSDVKLPVVFGFIFNIIYKFDLHFFGGDSAHDGSARHIDTTREQGLAGNLKLCHCSNESKQRI